MARGGRAGSAAGESSAGIEAALVMRGGLGEVESVGADVDDVVAVVGQRE